MPNKPEDPHDEPTFRVTDRRRVTPEEPQEPVQASEPRTEVPPEPPPRAETSPGEEEGRDLALLPIRDLALIFIAELQTRALMHLGLVPNPQTRLVAKDLPQAQLAIDCMAALIEQVSPTAGPGEHGQLRQILADLRLTFVRESAG